MLLAGLGLLCRLAFAFGYWIDKPLTHDEREYLALAASLSDGKGLTYPDDYETGTSPRFARAPGYPAVLAAIGARPAETAPGRVKILNSTLGAIALLLIGAIGMRVAGAKAAVAATAIAAVYPPLVWLPAYVFSESLYMPLAFGCVLLLTVVQQSLDAGQRHGLTNSLVLAAGVTAGVGILVRPAMLMFLPCVVLWLIVRRQLPLALAFAIAAMLAVAPWTLRNLRVHERLVLVAAEGGVTFWTGNHPLARGEGDLAANPDLKSAEIAFRRAQGDIAAEELERRYYADALAWITAHPGAWLKLVLAKAFYTVVPVGPSYTLHSARYLMMSLIAYGLVAPAGLIGIRRMASHRRGIPLLLLAASVVATALIFFPQERFRIPVIDPALILGTAIVLTGSLLKR